MSSGGLPLGLQLIGKPWEEGEMLNIAGVIERAAGMTARADRWW
ncbi:MAG: aspartyl-tRNA(Asn)/glutamyl-tRNA(Gln) amidotransferase subunit A [Paracoccaceae bacterium]|jgi:aspartyl-tRNA(Asn)/glutamyl-tRNA(Gln) amidotransferase subunit A